MGTDVAVAVVSYNTRPLTLTCLAAVERSVGSLNGDLMVVDNGSCDGTAEAIRSAHPRWRVLNLTENPGYGAALNRAFMSSDSPYLLALNADVSLDQGALAAMLAFVDAHPACGVVAPRLRYPDGSPQPSAKRIQSLAFALGEVLWVHELIPQNPLVQRLYYHEGDLSPGATVETVSGATMLIRRDAYRRVGGFDEGFRMYFEETDFCLRLNQCGYRSAVCEAATAVHWHGASTSRTAARQVEYYLSYIRFFRKHRGNWAARLLTGAIWLRAVIRYAASYLLHPPFSSAQRARLRDRLQVCLELLRSLRGDVCPAEVRG
jgi:GT2 family glycosyltransferase